LGETSPASDALPAEPEPRARRRLRQARFEIVSVLGRFPRLIPVLAPYRRAETVEPDTRFVIEGFPRSGNTFATAAFEVATKPRKPKLGHHVHSPAHVLAAVRLGVPVLVVVRPPKDAVLSFVIQQPHISIAQALRAYVRFHRTLLPHLDRFVVATFDQVTRDFGEVLARVQDRFGTPWTFEHTEENAREALRLIEEENRRRWAGGRLDAKGAFPSASRARLKARLAERYEDARLGRLSERAEALYSRFAEAAAG
jgi:hypothetical protein